MIRPEFDDIGREAILGQHVPRTQETKQVTAAYRPGHPLKVLALSVVALFYCLLLQLAQQRQVIRHLLNHPIQNAVAVAAPQAGQPSPVGDTQFILQILGDDALQRFLHLRRTGLDILPKQVWPCRYRLVGGKESTYVAKAPTVLLGSPAEEGRKQHGVSMAAHDFFIGHRYHRRANAAGDDALRMGVVGEIVRATLCIGEGKGSRVGTSPGAPGALNVVGGRWRNVAHQHGL